MKDHIWKHHQIGIISTNCFVFGDPSEAIMIDPGGNEAIEIAKNLLEQEIEIKHVLVTHGHFDHLGWAAEVQKVVEGAKVYLHKDEKVAYESFLNAIPRYGLDPVEIREPDVWIKDNQVLNLKGYKFQVIHTPGHSPGSVVYDLVDFPKGLNNPSFKDINSSFVGDSIFEGSIGRFDLPYSSPEDMKSSLKRLVSDLDPSNSLFPGHGNFTKMETELENNPYLIAIQKGISFF